MGDVCASEKVSGRAEVSRAACRLQHVSSPGSDAWSMRGGRSGLARLREEGGHSAVGKWRGVLCSCRLAAGAPRARAEVPSGALREWHRMQDIQHPHVLGLVCRGKEDIAGLRWVRRAENVGIAGAT